MTADEAPQDARTRLAAALAAGRPPQEAERADLLSWLAADPGGVVAACAPADDEAGAAAAIELLDFVSREGYPPGGLALTRGMAARFPDDERFADFELRYLASHQDAAAALALIERWLDRELRTVQLGYRVAITLNRMVPPEPLAERRAAALYRAHRRYFELAKRAPYSQLWLGRFYRDTGNAVEALKHYLAAYEAPAETARYKMQALREAADLALGEDRWGRDAPILLRARQAGVEVGAPWRFEAVNRVFDYVGGGEVARASLGPLANLPGSLAYSRLYDVVGTPEIAFDYLVDEVLPARMAYEPANRLLMLGTSLSAGGMERIFANSFRAVRASGLFDEVRMALLNFQSGEPTAFFAPDAGEEPERIAVLEAIGEPAFPISLLPVGLARRVWAAYRLIVEERPRVIHAWNDLPGTIAAFAGLLAGCPRIFVHFHHMRAINLSSDRNLIRSYPACYRRLLERPEIRLLFVADAAADDYADWWGVERTDKFQRLYNGFTELDAPAEPREALKERLGLPADGPIIGTVFRFDPVKRPRLWIEAAARVAAARPDASFLMVGGGALWEPAREQVAALGLTGRFVFPGQVRNVADYLACLDLFMLTSRVEGLPNSLIEAQLAGVPVITADVGGAGETFEAEVSGRGVADADPERLAAACLACLGDAAWMARARVASREQALRRFGIEEYLRNLLRIYAA